LSATFDEPTYIRLGLESWRSGTSRKLLDLGTMPLPAHLQTLPLYLRERWRGQASDTEADMARLLPAARLGTLPFWWLLLITAWVAARRLGGPWASGIAVGFLACEPNLLAHASLATTDIPVTAALLGLFTHFSASRESRWFRRVGLTALWFALAVLTKASGLAFAVLGMIAIEVGQGTAAATTQESCLGSATPFGLRMRKLDWRVLPISALGLALAFLYCGSDWEVSPSFVQWGHSLPEGPGKGVVVWVAEHLKIFSNAGVALARQLRHNIQGHGVFLLDQVAPRAVWYYFPLALTMKAPIPLLLLPVVLLASQPKALGNWACRVAVALLLFSFLCRVQTGIRLVLPLIAVAILGLAAASAEALGRMGPGLWHRLLLGGIWAGVAWVAVSAGHLWPHGLCYINELWGGTRLGYHCLSDSNYDWGQGLKELARWQKTHQVRDLTVFYYGTDPTLRQLPMRRLETESPPRDASVVPASLRGRAVAVGTTILHGSVRELSWVRPWVEYLQHYEPVDRTTTFLIYRFPEWTEESAVAARHR
jgi:hypothetical protein